MEGTSFLQAELVVINSAIGTAREQGHRGSGIGNAIVT